jgi:hypothetical protein
MLEKGEHFDEVACRMNKIPVIVYRAVGMCSCSQSGFLGRISEAITPFREFISYREDSAGCEEAIRSGIRYRAIVVGSRVLKSNPTKKEIEEAIRAEASKNGISLE